MGQWAAGGFNSALPEETHAANHAATAQYKLLQELIELDYGKFTEVMKDDDET